MKADFVEVVRGHFRVVVDGVLTTVDGVVGEKRVVSAVVRQGRRYAAVRKLVEGCKYDRLGWILRCVLYLVCLRRCVGSGAMILTRAGAAR